MVEHQPSKLDTWVRFPSPAWLTEYLIYMREWLSGGVSPCQGEGRGFESRLALEEPDRKSIGFFYFIQKGGLLMIKHIVCFKLKDNSEENKLKAKEVLLSMKGNVPMLRNIEVGVDFLGSERSYDVILQVELDDAKALDAYQEDPYHVNVVKKHMHQVREASVAIDYVME